MGHKVTLGGDRLGSGKKDKVEIEHYGRSSHDLSEIFRSSMSAGTLVPFLCKPMLPTDVWDIDLDVNVMTHPTVGPLFGSAKVQLDLFRIPLRLYNGLLHMNKTEQGLKMNEVKLPQIYLEATPSGQASELKEQINPSALLRYLGIKGLGTIEMPSFRDTNERAEEEARGRYFNAVPLLAYWDIVKNYYANKQEKVVGVIEATDWQQLATVNVVSVFHPDPADLKIIKNRFTPEDQTISIKPGSTITLNGSKEYEIDEKKVWLVTTTGERINIATLGERLNYTIHWRWEAGSNGHTRLGEVTNWAEPPYQPFEVANVAYFEEEVELNNIEPTIGFYSLENIDEMRMDILSKVKDTSAFIIDKNTIQPYSSGFGEFTTPFAGKEKTNGIEYPQVGLAIKTYQSDIFNNWLDTEWLDGESGINKITAVDTSEGEFTLDALILARKVYDMLNNIAVSGGSYYDWMQANWGHDALRQVESPVYEGGLSKELVFQEVVSNSASVEGETTQPLGTLGGRGKLSTKHLGGRAVVKADEISYIIGIASITPRLDYSQGNNWDVNLKTMDDFHKPALDQIGFQDLLTDQMAWWDTKMAGLGTNTTITTSAVGKQPAWLNYQTSFNKNYGNFAIESQEMFMVFDRRYEVGMSGEGPKIKDLTTYIDPKKFNYIFADTRRDAQNYWVQIAIDIHARRQMSAKVMPNL